MKGAGAWLRKVSDIAPEVAAEFLDFVVIPIHSSRGDMNRGPTARAWVEAYQDGGGRVYVMDWLPSAGGGHGHVEDCCDYARSIGAVGYVVDAEPDAGWRHAVVASREYARELASHAGDMERLVTDYGRGGMTYAPMRAWLDTGMTAVPQSYDPAGGYAEGYHAKSVIHWRGRGAQRVVLGVSLWLRSQKRHRTPDEFGRHIEHVPDDVDAICMWYGAGRGGRTSRHLRGVLEQLRKWSRGRFGATVSEIETVASRETMPAPTAFDRSRIADLAAEAKEAGDEDAARELGWASIKLR